MDSQNVYLGPPRPEPVALADRRASLETRSPED